jgi:transcriptional regulator
MTNDRTLYALDAHVAADPAAIVRRYPFALFITAGPAGILASSIPMFFEMDTSDSTLIGHMARRNQQVAGLTAGQSALAVFAGPHAYISSRWYREKPTVPTWNYLTAHVRGTIEPIDDAQLQLDILRRSAAVMESDSETPWTMEQAPAGRIELLLPMIRSFRMTVTRIEGVTKLNQTHPPADRLRIIEHLLERSDGDSHEIARLMMQLTSDVPQPAPTAQG